MKCRLCFDVIDEEHPDTIYGVNPETFRIGMMHLWCFLSAYEVLNGVSAIDTTRFIDRQDEYDQFVQERI